MPPEKYEVYQPDLKTPATCDMLGSYAESEIMVKCDKITKLMPMVWLIPINGSKLLAVYLVFRCQKTQKAFQTP